MTYLLDALRSLLTDGWDPAALAAGAGAVGAVSVRTLAMSTMALRGRVSRS